MSKVKKQPEIIERMDRLVDNKHYLPNRTFAITLAMLQYIEKEENYGGLKDTTTLPQ
jgi:hypothetical protein